jgi:hypothetical protein
MGVAKAYAPENPVSVTNAAVVPNCEPWLCAALCHHHNGTSVGLCVALGIPSCKHVCLRCSLAHAVDQRHDESAGRWGGKPSVQSMSQDPLNTQYIATGGGDALGEKTWLECTARAACSLASVSCSLS